VAATEWCKSYGRRAFEEELRPTPLGPVAAHMATPLEQQLAKVLGVEDQSHWPRLPMEVGSCEQGGSCCWRWLARAAMEQAAGEPMSHLVLADMVSTVRGYMKELQELRSWSGEVQTELSQAVTDRHEIDRMRLELTDCRSELVRLKVNDGQLHKLEGEHGKLEEDYSKLKMQEDHLRKQHQILQADHKFMVEGDLAAARHRADQAENELTKSVTNRVQSQVMTEDVNRQLARAMKELQAQKVENGRLREEWEKAVRPKGTRKKTPRSGSRKVVRK